jgi:hypothetical protein
MFDTGGWRGLAVVGDGIERQPGSQTEPAPAALSYIESASDVIFWFCDWNPGDLLII